MLGNHFPGNPNEYAARHRFYGRPIQIPETLEDLYSEMLGKLEKTMELQKNKIGRRFPKYEEFAPNLCHKDWLIDEMKFLYIDFIEEAKWKKAKAFELAHTAKSFVDYRNVNLLYKRGIKLTIKHSLTKAFYDVYQADKLNYGNNSNEADYSHIKSIKMRNNNNGLGNIMSRLIKEHSFQHEKIDSQMEELREEMFLNINPENRTNIRGGSQEEVFPNEWGNTWNGGSDTNVNLNRGTSIKIDLLDGLTDQGIKGEYRISSGVQDGRSTNCNNLINEMPMNSTNIQISNSMTSPTITNIPISEQIGHDSQSINEQQMVNESAGESQSLTERETLIQNELVQNENIEILNPEYLITQNIETKNTEFEDIMKVNETLNLIEGTMLLKDEVVQEEEKVQIAEPTNDNIPMEELNFELNADNIFNTLNERKSILDEDDDDKIFPNNIIYENNFNEIMGNLTFDKLHNDLFSRFVIPSEISPDVESPPARDDVEENETPPKPKIDIEKQLGNLCYLRNETKEHLQPFVDNMDLDLGAPAVFQPHAKLIKKATYKQSIIDDEYDLKVMELFCDSNDEYYQNTYHKLLEQRNQFTQPTKCKLSTLGNTQPTSTIMNNQSSTQNGIMNQHNASSPSKNNIEPQHSTPPLNRRSNAYALRERDQITSEKKEGVGGTNSHLYPGIFEELLIEWGVGMLGTTNWDLIADFLNIHPLSGNNIRNKEKIWGQYESVLGKKGKKFSNKYKQEQTENDYLPFLINNLKPYFMMHAHPRKNIYLESHIEGLLTLKGKVKIQDLETKIPSPVMNMEVNNIEGIIENELEELKILGKRKKFNEEEKSVPGVAGFPRTIHTGNNPTIYALKSEDLNLCFYTTGSGSGYNSPVLKKHRGSFSSFSGCPNIAITTDSLANKTTIFNIAKHLKNSTGLDAFTAQKNLIQSFKDILLPNNMESSQNANTSTCQIKIEEETPSTKHIPGPKHWDSKPFISGESIKYILRKGEEGHQDIKDILEHPYLNIGHLPTKNWEEMRSPWYQDNNHLAPTKRKPIGERTERRYDERGNSQMRPTPGQGMVRHGYPANYISPQMAGNQQMYTTTPTNTITTTPPVRMMQGMENYRAMGAPMQQQHGNTKYRYMIPPTTEQMHGVSHPGQSQSPALYPRYAQSMGHASRGNGQLVGSISQSPHIMHQQHPMHNIQPHIPRPTQIHSHPQGGPILHSAPQQHLQGGGPTPDLNKEE